MGNRTEVLSMTVPYSPAKRLAVAIRTRTQAMIQMMDSAHQPRAASISRAILLLADAGREHGEFDPAAKKRWWACVLR
jgi:hypothetical protein